ncbi:Hypothetical protein PAS_chr4_0255 [Komagataella phaffii GS115]|uniref:V-type proton ATPase subunit G n=1 Tax=Komagataella phaffii (strain GS115 / ATCC 20864) TaxID=644223 RepID=C4R7B1_KOMPG|nr:Hypothetical protein PAS_chr4_0255 [Komagataella phaffii GS115]CAY71486.1 Hypothetical protein PAS_chr4_0255 [Komagataella phaffii GS115]
MGLGNFWLERNITNKHLVRSSNFAEDRTQRLKEAKLDAAKDIKEYKQKKEKELKEHEAQFSGSNDDLEKAAESEVQTELVEIDKSAEAKKEDVVKLLLDAITHPKPELHVNARA